MSVATSLRLLLLAALALGHIGFWIWLFNRANAVGLERDTIKRIEKVLILTCLVLPFLFLAWEWNSGVWGDNFEQVWDRIHQQDGLYRASAITRLYGGFVLLFLAVVGPMWIAHRPAFTVAGDRYKIANRQVQKKLHLENPEWILGRLTRHCVRLPGNEILSLETNVKRLRLEGVASAMRGFRIGHLSDIHLTGEVTPDFSRYCVDWLIDQGIEMLVVSGDLVDDAKAIAMLEPVFGNLSKSLPKVFVLGNHDKAHGLVEQARDAMVHLGWMDAGAADWKLPTPRGIIQVLGNELPWLDRHVPEPSNKNVRDQDAVCTIGVAHSPDQLAWGRRQACHLLLCGHTHGGQIRFPGIGPIVAPSWHGSRYASGVFYRSPTVMHVSRGLSGVHPLRWRCAPEATVLEIVDEW